MDKVLDRFEAISKWTRKSHIFQEKLFPGEVVGSSHDDSDGAGQAAQAEAQGGSPH